MSNNIKLDGVEVPVTAVLIELGKLGDVEFVPTPPMLTEKVFSGVAGLTFEGQRPTHGRTAGAKQLTGPNMIGTNRNTWYAGSYARTLARAIAWAEGDNNA